eukprot:scaffold84262_cov19-Prasinocladus_malaysianus.AAC.1
MPEVWLQNNIISESTRHASMHGQAQENTLLTDRYSANSAKREGIAGRSQSGRHQTSPMNLPELIQADARRPRIESWQQQTSATRIGRCTKASLFVNAY